MREGLISSNHYPAFLLRVGQLMWVFLGRNFLRLLLLKSPTTMRAASSREFPALSITPYDCSGDVGVWWNVHSQEKDVRS